MGESRPWSAGAGPGGRAHDCDAYTWRGRSASLRLLDRVRRCRQVLDSSAEETLARTVTVTLVTLHQGSAGQAALMGVAVLSDMLDLKSWL